MCIRDRDDAGFDGYVYRTLCESKRKGVRGLKFWKNLSLGILDQTGSYIPLNDRRLSPVWQYAAQLGMPVLLHVGDPEAFFSPVTPQNERYEELQALSLIHICHWFHAHGAGSDHDCVRNIDQRGLLSASIWNYF